RRAGEGHRDTDDHADDGAVQAGADDPGGDLTGGVAGHDRLQPAEHGDGVEHPGADRDGGERGDAENDEPDEARRPRRQSARRPHLALAAASAASGRNSSRTTGMVSGVGEDSAAMSGMSVTAT